MGYKAVFFDFDYTLGDATEAIVAGYTHAMTTMGYPAPTVDAIRHTVGYMLEDAFTLLTGEASPARREEFRARFAEVAKPMQRAGVPLFPGAAELIRWLHEAGVAVAVVSSKNTATLAHIMDGHGLSECLSGVVGGDMVSKPKPDPEGILTTMARLELTPQDILFCGDTVIDAGAARNAGVDFCAVLNGTTQAPAFAEFPHVYIARNLGELLTWLRTEQ